MSKKLYIVSRTKVGDKEINSCVQPKYNIETEDGHRLLKHNYDRIKFMPNIQRFLVADMNTPDNYKELDILYMDGKRVLDPDIRIIDKFYHVEKGEEGPLYVVKKKSDRIYNLVKADGSIFLDRWYKGIYNPFGTCRYFPVDQGDGMNIIDAHTGKRVSEVCFEKVFIGYKPGFTPSPENIVTVKYKGKWMMLRKDGSLISPDK